MENEQSEPMSPAEVTAADAIVLSAAVTVQCLECGSTLILEVYNPDPTEDALIVEGSRGCPTCTAKQGRPIVIDVAILAGSQLDVLPDDEDEDQAPPAAAEQLDEADEDTP